VIAAAALKAPSIISNSNSEMGPPIMPASAYKKRPQTPNLKTTAAVNTPKTGGTTPRPRYPAPPRSDVGRSGASSPAMTRRSSVSSFASEVDRRLEPGSNIFGPSGLDPDTTDPRMIQAITQTMIGEFLWKYTRKTGPGREEMSENRHRRFFWVHPYTRTLYWSEKDPASAGRAQLKAKSVAIEAVQVVSDDNPYPPGLHRKSLVIITPGRTIKLTATTGQRHDTWFNALSYLLQRTGEEQSGNHADQGEATDDVHEFNPAYRSSSRQTTRSRTSSFFSRRTSSPHHTQVPTLRHPTTPSIKRAQSTEPGQEPPSGRMSSLSGMFRPSPNFRASFHSRRSRVGAQEAAEYQVPEENGSNYDITRTLASGSVLTNHIEGMENVRACCDGQLRVSFPSYSAANFLCRQTRRRALTPSYPQGPP
jgi:hypothetical protein